MPTMKTATASAMSGVGLCILFAIIGGLSTYVLKDGVSLSEYIESKVVA